MELIDSFARRIEYLRLSVTDRCDLRCFYCLPRGHRDFEPPANWLRFDEIRRVVAVFAGLGVRRLRVTGGEPLTRRGLPELVRDLSTVPGLDDISLSTNAVRLRDFAADLRDAGVARVNVSLDTLNAQRFTDITGGELSRVLAGLRAAREAGLAPIKINMVVMKGVNDDELEAMVDYCVDNGFTLRFIETMPVGDTGRTAVGHYLDLDTVRERLQGAYGLVPDVLPGGGPARYFRVPGSATSIGFITPMSRHFCETCNRVRLTVDGDVLLCLGQEDKIALREPLRDGATDSQLQDLILQGIARKPERHHFTQRPEQVLRFMSSTGG